ncbi:MAG TPA: thiamine phosphate synthase, partial [Chthonomonadaceae bacterium]|nr:thiamine phosphate synthase [Chthonomonadaceae bacterium]
RRVDTPHTHGTGCFLSSAIATYLAIGARLIEAIQCAKALLTLALTVPTAPGQGRGWPDVGAALRAINSPSPATSRHGDRLRVLASGLYVITDWRPRPGRSPDEFVEQAIAGGAATIQLRDKRLTAPELIDAARRLIGICRPRGALLIVNDRMDVALAAGADGVHLGPDDMAPAPARRILGQDRLIGVSTGTVEEARAAAPYASYLGVGAIFGSATKLDAGEAVGPGRITQIRAALGDACPPIVAIGGITARNIGEVARAGADTAAVVSAVADAEDVRAAVHRLNHDFLD